ncbi:hypothetical protein ETJ91_01455 [Bacillus albus]|nr:hypothetical protein ETJ91_01455 [Bacillus albus]RXJ29885.1 hypothetical protein ETJ76_14635 [Bacillus albus]RXJ31477.1 hypothetical protein ETJ90_07410 [Bacillus albus]RXJ42701.1 hypothetical protein ETJ89_07415 [Bacillus albus]RXJ59629.1 hypothetical protein ETJ66_07410 [Bacillus albus]
MIFLRTPAINIPGHFLYLPSIRVHIILCFSKKNACLLIYYYILYNRELSTRYRIHTSYANF